jgi:hypothetical protein
MFGDALVYSQVIFASIAVFVWRAFDPDSWANSVLSYIINVSIQTMKGI